MSIDPMDRRRLLAAIAAAPLITAAGQPAAVAGGAPASFSVKDFGAVGDGNADDTASIQAGLLAIRERGGGALFFPRGRYKVTRPLRLVRNLTLHGEGQRGSIIVSTHNGSCLVSEEPINGATPVHLSIRSLGLINTAGAANRGAGFHDTGGTYVAVTDVLIENFRYGIILDQSELVDIDLCTIQHQSHSCIWLVNGPDLVPGAALHFTNRISVNRCQINGAGQFGILDDGGVTHAFRDNNYNGCGLAHIRAASVTNLIVSGGEYEGAGTRNLILTFHRLSGVQVGACGLVLVENAFFAPLRGQSSIEIHSCTVLTLVACLFGNTHDPKVAAVVGVENVNTLLEIGCAIGGPGPLLDRPGNPTSKIFSTTKMASRRAGPPRDGQWDKGDIVWNSHIDPAQDRVDYWKCVESGSPGRWIARP
jgi:hypothetical protein